MRHVLNAFAGVVVTHAPQAAAWYARVLGAHTHAPMPGVYEWTLERGGVLQVFEDAENAGHASVTFAVADLEQAIERLQSLGVDVFDRTAPADVSTVQVRDADGNRVVFAQRHTHRVAG